MSNATISPDALLAQMRAMAEAAQGQNAKPAATEGPQQADFADLLKQSIEKVNMTQQEANRLTTAFQSGDPNVQLADVMVALQKSNVSFQAMIQVRNKLVNAYQEIMNMQI